MKLWYNKKTKKTAKIHKANLSRIFVRCAFTFWGGR